MNTNSIGEQYIKSLLDAELVDYGPTRGDIIIRPYAYAIWNRINEYIGNKLIEIGFQEAYFPLLLPQSLLEEETHFLPTLNPRLFSISEGGGKTLPETLVIRPSSESIVNYMFAKWVKSYRDLPIRVFQKCNIARWEEVTHPFLKGREILWLEGHAVYSSHESAISAIKSLHKLFNDLYQNLLAIPTMSGVEPQTRKFVGSENTYSYEAFIPNGRTLQLGALYDLGTIFSKIYDVTFHNSDNKAEYCWGINFGFGFRLLGALVLIHGDDRGLVLPPNLAPIQIVFVPINGKANGQIVSELAVKLVTDLKAAGIRAYVSDVSYGSVRKDIEYWEKRGVPLIVPIGQQEVLSSALKYIVRYHPNGEQWTIDKESVVPETKTLLQNIQNLMFERCQSRQRENTYCVSDNIEFEQQIDRGWVMADMCEDLECETMINQRFGKIIKCKVGINNNDRCIFCQRKATRRVLFSRTY